MTPPSACIGCGATALAMDGTLAVCGACSLRFAAQARPLDYSQAYTGEDEVYAAHYRVLDRVQSLDQLDALLLPFEKILRDRLAARADVQRVVDLGCGIGRFLRAVRLSGKQAAGYEMSPALVQALVRHGNDVRQGTAETFLAQPEGADAISLLEVVEHLTAPGALITRLLREKRPRLLFVVVPEWAVRRRHDRNFAEHDQPPNHLSWWSAPALQALLAREGYRAQVDLVPEKRRSLVGHFVRDRRRASPGAALRLARGLVRPPPFWLLGTAERGEP